MPPTFYLLTRRGEYTDRRSDPNFSMDGIFALGVEHAVQEAIPWALVSSYNRIAPGKILVKFELEGSHVLPGFSDGDIRDLSEFVNVERIPEERYEALLLRKLKGNRKQN